MLYLSTFVAQMKVVAQRVSRASVQVAGQTCGKIERGILILVGIEDRDTQNDADWLALKLANLRIFDDEKGVMNRSILDSDGDVLVISQFTLMASVLKGNRPSYVRASKPERAIPLYEYFCSACEAILQKPVARGVFGADMQVELVNDGPVTIIIDTNERN